MSEANKTQVAGDHYKSAFQHWDYVALAGIAYLPAQVSKYLVRWQKKNGLQDLKKALHFLDKFIEDEGAKYEANMARAVSFCQHNDLKQDEIEQYIICSVQNYLSGNLGILQNSRLALAEKVFTLEQKAASFNDPTFKEERDEWKTN
jgi:hypothetical protein